MKHIAIYPGSFDPPTEGHINIVERATRLFDQVIVAVAVNTTKKTTLTPEERVRLFKEIFKENPSVQIASFQNKLVVNYARSKKATVLLRGLRTIQDYEFENQMALANKALAPEIETIFMMTESRYAYLSSSLIKEIVSLGGSLEGMVRPVVEKRLREKLKR